MNRATLRCGAVLFYEAPSFVPADGDVVPCRRHGYCVVTASTSGASSGRTRRGTRRAQRTREELMEFLKRRPVTTVHTLRRHRFTLRMIAAAESDGLLDVDLGAGVIALQPRG